MTSENYLKTKLRSHYPVFHQMEGLRVFSEFELSQMISNPEGFTLFDPDQKRDENQQAGYSTDAMGLLEINLKRTLESLVKHLFGDNVEYRIVETTFPFTHPSWEIEVFYQV